MARTPLMGRVQKAFRMARMANLPGAPGVAELIELEHRAGLSRRSFLQAGAAFLGAGLLVGCGDTAEQYVFTNSNTGTVQPRIAILGAGIAGLNAARVLARAGYSSQLYEAQTRIGGRMFTATGIFAPDVTTELGGEFIDTINVEMLDLVREYNLPLIDVQTPSELALTQTTWFFGGTLLTDADVIALLQPFVDTIVEDRESLPDFINFATRDANAVAFDQLSIADYLDQLGITGVLRDLLDVAYETENGSAITQQSALNFISEIDTEFVAGDFAIFGDSDQRFKIRGGNQLLPQAIARSLEQVAPVNLGYELVSLGQRTSEYVMTFNTPDGAREVTADIVVCTIPFSVLRTLDVTADIPQAVRDSIQTMNYGTNSKLIMGMSQPIWRDQGRTGLFFNDLPSQSGWDSSQLQNGSAASMTCFLGGLSGVALAEDTPEDWATRFLPDLDQMYPGVAAQYNNLVTRFTWPTFPYSRGSYSCFGPGQVTGQLGVANELQGNLYFAGEHTSIDNFGFMEGGAETGRRAAEQILTRLGIEVQPRERRTRMRRAKDRHRESGRELQLK